MNRLLSLFFALLALGFCACGGRQAAASEDGDTAAPVPAQFSADSAMASICRQCAFGPRVPGSEAHRRCGDYIAESFRAEGLEVVEQRAEVVDYAGRRLPLRNIIASWRPDETERVLVCAHWDSRPWADADPDTANHRKPVPAANDGASGVAVMLEAARHLAALDIDFGVDFICFDLEDGGAPYWEDDIAPADGTDWCLGSRYWARTPHRADYVARWGILLDMVGTERATFRLEGFSMRYAAPIVGRLWAAARTAGAADYFLNEDGGYATDDHVPLNETAGIPTVDVIPYMSGAGSNFGPTWHTLADTPENISPATLRAVGQTLLQMLYEEKR